MGSRSVYLGDQIAVLDSQVMDDHPIGAVPVVHLHLVGSFLFAANARLDVAKLLLDAFFRRGVSRRVVEKILKDGFLWLLVVGWLDDHVAMLMRVKCQVGWLL